ncbi:PH domain-containing protein [Candidatus Parcubacteria bacterium]|nr:PH domain-containing protein [Candidatus Parcubacteria bacterium]
MVNIILEEGERIILEIRKHWLVFISEAFIIFISALAPLIMLAFVVKADIVHIPEVSARFSNLFLFVYALWLLVLWMVLFLFWTDYYLDVWLVTDRRIIAIDQKGLFNRQVSSFRLDTIQDITVETNGILPTLFDFGNVLVETAAEIPMFKIPSVAHVTKVKEIITDEHNKAIEKHSLKI